ncbi:MAG: hypothetical protein QM811_16880 [Pirellulales bacterium]
MVGDVVTHNGSVYVCILANNTTSPPNEAYWLKLLQPSLNWRGAWSNGVDYAVGDAVTHEGNSYLCKQSAAQRPPPIRRTMRSIGTCSRKKATWARAGTGGVIVRGVWNGSDTYAIGEGVLYGSGWWLSMIDGNFGNAPASGSAYWLGYDDAALQTALALLPSQILAWNNDWSPAYYDIGRVVRYNGELYLCVSATSGYESPDNPTQWQRFYNGSYVPPPDADPSNWDGVPATVHEAIARLASDLYAYNGNMPISTLP